MSDLPFDEHDPSETDADPTQRAGQAKDESGSLWQESQEAGADVSKKQAKQSPSAQKGALFNQMLGRREDESQQATPAEDMQDDQPNGQTGGQADGQTGGQAQDQTQKKTASGGGQLKPIVRLVDVYKSFGPLKVLEGVSLEIYPGKTTVIIGPSGTGKSVLLKIICGLLKPDRGEVWYGGIRVDGLGEKKLVAIRKKMGMLFQMGALFDSMTVGDNIAFPLLEHKRTMSAKERHERCLTMLKIVGLKDVAKKMPADLSGGQKKRVALARAIILEPELVLYDEPTTGLDPIRSDIINELILGLTRQLGITSIVVTHDMVSADKIADRMVMLYDGKIVIDGTPSEFHQTDNDLVKRFILGQADQDELTAIREGIDPVAKR